MVIAVASLSVRLLDGHVVRLLDASHRGYASHSEDGKSPHGLLSDTGRPAEVDPPWRLRVSRYAWPGLITAIAAALII
jgi:hypothetical protein